MSDNENAVSVSVTAENQFSDWLQLIYGEKASISISGTWSATVTIQRKRRTEAATAARDVLSFSANAELTLDNQGVWDYRIGVKTGGFSSGTVVAELSK